MALKSRKKNSTVVVENTKQREMKGARNYTIQIMPSCIPLFSVFFFCACFFLHNTKLLLFFPISFSFPYCFISLYI